MYIMFNLKYRIAMDCPAIEIKTTSMLQQSDLCCGRNARIISYMTITVTH